MNPSVSVIIPTFNREELIVDTLDSVLNQTFENWECIVVDDGSTDNTKDVLEKYISTDKRFNYFSRKNEPKGASSCRNIGIREAKGDYIIFLDSDDCLGPVCLENRILNIEKEPNYDFWVYLGLEFENKIGDSDILWNILKGTDDLRRFLKMDVPWSITGPIWDKKVLKDLKGFKSEVQAWQDWELSIRAIIGGHKYKKYNTADHYIRTSEHQTISKDVGNHKLTKNLIELVKGLFKDYPQLAHYQAEVKRLLFYLLLIYREEMSVKDLINASNMGIFNKQELIYMTAYFKKPIKRGTGFLIRKIFKKLDVNTYADLIDQSTFRSVSFKEYPN